MTTSAQAMARGPLTREEARAERDHYVANGGARSCPWSLYLLGRALPGRSVRPVL